MDLVLYHGGGVLRGSAVTVQVRTSDRQQVEELVKRTARQVKTVNDEQSYTDARRAAAELKGVAKEIHEAKRAAKRHFEVILEAIEDLAKELNGPVQAEETRILELVTGYVRLLEQKQKELEAARKAKLEAEEYAHQQKIIAMQAQNQPPQAIADAETLRALELEVRAMTMEPAPGIVPGGRVTHPYRFKLVNAAETVNAGEAGRLLRIELNILGCNDAVRIQLERAPDRAPTLPGIEVTQEINVVIKAASRIS